MKKSFMTRALATGLSLAMAFSLAASDVSVASAAAKPAMKKTSFAVQVGGKTKTYHPTKATKKNFKITKVVSKDTAIAKAKKAKSGTVVKVSPGTGTKAGKTKVVITFQNKKSKKTTKVKIPCTLKVKKQEEEKPEVKALTMTAEATGVQEIKATFNKAIGSDAKITLKKGTADVPMKAEVAGDGMSATLTLTGKLSDGTYTVTVVAGEETVTADIEAKNEVLTSFKVGAALKELTRNSSTASAIFSYEALNQYGQKMNYTPAQTAVTVSSGKVDKITACKTTQAGTVTVLDIPAMLAVPGQSFTVVMVDTVNNTGITLNTTIPYGSKATAKEFTSAGVYNVNKGAFRDVADNDKIADYALLFTCKDQYGDDMSADDVAKLASEGAIQVIIAGATTGIKADAEKFKTELSTLEVNETTYFKVPYTGMTTDADLANAGTYTVQILNNTLGSVYNGDFAVTSGTVIGDIQISQNDSIYADQDNELNYTVTDIDGKEIKDYATLKDIKIEGNHKEGSKDEKEAFTWKKNADGTAKLVYNPVPMIGVDSVRAYRNTSIRSCLITANKAISGKYVVKSQTFTVYYQRVPLSVEKLTSGAPTIVTGDDPVKVELKHLVLLDQYQNPYTEAELKAGAETIGTQVFAMRLPGSASAISAGATKLTEAGSAGAIGTGLQVAIANNKEVQKVSLAVSNAAVVELVGNVEADSTKGFSNGYTATFTKQDPNGVSGLYIASVNDGCPLYADGVTTKAQLLLGDVDKTPANPSAAMIGKVVVKGKINGKDITLDPSQCSLVGANSNNVLELAGVQSYSLAQKVITEKREFSVIVRTNDGSQTVTGEVEVSNAPVAAATISLNDKATATYEAASSGAFAYATADQLFVVKSQYGSVVTGVELVTYTVESAVVTGGAVTYKGVQYGNGADSKKLPVDAFMGDLNGSNKATLKLAGVTGGTATTASGSGTSIDATVVVKGQVPGTDNSVEKKITVTFKW